MILVDTSVWIDHLRGRDEQLMDVLESAQVLMHPFVLGEIACGHLTRRTHLLALLHDLPAAMVATDTEVLAFIERRKLMGRGIGYIDVHLLASVALMGASKLWTRDKLLRKVAAEMRLASNFA